MSLDIKVEHLSATCVRLTCLLDASAERLYRAWTTPSEVGRWFVPERDAKCEVTEMDVRVGGKYSMSIVMPGVTHTTTGEYLALEPNRLIKFTWEGTCGTEQDAVSEVTVELAPVEGKTQLILTHGRLANVASREQHAQGWIGCLTGLMRYTANR